MGAEGRERESERGTASEARPRRLDIALRVMGATQEGHVQIKF